MTFSSSYPAETRRAVEALLSTSALPMVAIAERCGVTYDRVKVWNRQARIRPWNQAAKLQADPRHWTVQRSRAASRLFGRGDIDPADVAEALGARRSDAPALALACSVAAASLSPTLGPPGAAPDIAALDAALCTHIARQIAAFDETLDAAADGADSAKVLRDLGGLKRLLDDLAARARQSHSDGDADGGSPQDLAALRARIAQRYEAFEAERNDTGLPEPSGTGGTGEPGA